MTNNRQNIKNVYPKHNERCKKCKETVQVMLKMIYGAAEINHDLRAGTRPEDFAGLQCASALQDIFRCLQNHRGYREFVRAKRLPRCDFFVPDPGFVVEFDESQHFTALRKVSLTDYPDGMKLGFSRQKWIGLCGQINAKDNDPYFRDEQRAWYDTLRDYMTDIKGFGPTVRLYSKEMQWCSLDPSNSDDIGRFQKLMEEKQGGA